MLLALGYLTISWRINHLSISEKDWIALGGGAVFGAAPLGVVKAIEEKGI